MRSSLQTMWVNNEWIFLIRFVYAWCTSLKMFDYSRHIAWMKVAVQSLKVVVQSLDVFVSKVWGLTKRKNWPNVRWTIRNLIMYRQKCSFQLVEKRDGGTMHHQHMHTLTMNNGIIARWQHYWALDCNGGWMLNWLFHLIVMFTRCLHGILMRQYFNKYSCTRKYKRHHAAKVFILGTRCSSSASLCSNGNFLLFCKLFECSWKRP